MKHKIAYISLLMSAFLFEFAFYFTMFYFPLVYFISGYELFITLYSVILCIIIVIINFKTTYQLIKFLCL